MPVIPEARRARYRTEAPFPQINSRHLTVKTLQKKLRSTIEDKKCKLIGPTIRLVNTLSI